MRNVVKKIFPVVVLVLLLAACPGVNTATSSDKQRDTQERQVGEGVAQVGVPAIKNFRELKFAKEIYELRDQTGLATYSYLWSDLAGELIFLCTSIGYPIPYATQFSAPESMQRYYLEGTTGRARSYGEQRLPQAEPNGLFSPASAEGTWVLCKDPIGKEVRPTYVEPRVIVSQFKLL